jgi:hypothetical protein
VEVWPENWPAFTLFRQMHTQWYVGMGGYTGLNYLVLWALIDRMGLSKAEADQLFGDIQCMEYAALSVMNKKSKD